jgi:hypothetical protein
MISALSTQTTFKLRSSDYSPSPNTHLAGKLLYYLSSTSTMSGSLTSIKQSLYKALGSNEEATIRADHLIEKWETCGLIQKEQNNVKLGLRLAEMEPCPIYV